MFPGYLFMKGQKEDAYPAERSKRAVQVLPVMDEEQFELELLNIYRTVQADGELRPHAYGLEVGTRVEVRSGPFRGVQGRVESLGNRARLILTVTTLGRAMSMEIDGCLLGIVD